MQEPSLKPFAGRTAMPLASPVEAKAGPGVAAGARGAAQDGPPASYSRGNLIFD